MGNRAAEFAGAPEPAGWQAQKSAATRTLIVEAASRCIVELGYAGTTTGAVAEQAGLSRGAMLHHFPAKLDLLRATIEFLHQARLNAFRRALERAVRGDADRVHRLVEACWTDASQPAFVATVELAVAGRSDAALASALAPAQQAFARRWHELARALWLGADAAPGVLETELELCRHLVEGLALGALLGGMPARTEAALRQVETALRPLFRDAAGA